jgi:hypothetical protein
VSKYVRVDDRFVEYEVRTSTDVLWTRENLIGKKVSELKQEYNVEDEDIKMEEGVIVEVICVYLGKDAPENHSLWILKVKEEGE